MINRAEPEPAPSPEFLELLANTDWDDLTPRLLAYAAYRLRRYGRFKERLSETAADFVQHAIMLALTGKRRFPAERGISLFVFLCVVIDSLMSHDAERAGRVTFLSTDVADDETIDPSERPTLPSYEIEREIEARDEAEQFISSLDEDLRAYVRLRVYGDYTSAAEYARALNTTVAQIRTFDRRLRRMRKRSQ